MAVVLCLSASALEIPAPGQDTSALRVRLEVHEKSYYVGEGIELAVAVAARDQRPQIELPRLSRAEIWSAGNSFRPLSTSGIGNFVTGRNLYLTRLRLVPHQIGPLLIPPVAAHLDGLSGKSKALMLEIEPVPLLGRPAEFVGGIGTFSVEASVTPAAIRLGQELIYRITIKGPAAWGSVNRPELSRLKRSSLAPRIENLADEIDHEPPKRTWVYRIRPTRPGNAVLPPVSIAAYDPEPERYITRVTPGLAVKVTATQTVDLQTFHYAAPDTDGKRRLIATTVFAAYLIMMIVATGLAVVFQKTAQPDGEIGPKCAQRFARRFARKLATRSRAIHRRDSAETDARTVIDGLISYAQVGTGRPPGAITPVEASRFVFELTGSDQLSNHADALVAHCDQVLFSSPEAHDGTQLISRARDLFQALGRREALTGRSLKDSADHSGAVDHREATKP